MTRTFVVALLLVAGPAACKPSAPGAQTPQPDRGAGSASAAAPPADPTPPPSALTDADFDAIMKDVMSYMTALGAAAAEAKGDCPKMAVAIERVVGEHAELAARAAQLDDDPTAEDRADAWMKANEGTTRPTFEKLIGEIQRCGQDEAVQAAVAKIGSM